MSYRGHTYAVLGAGTSGRAAARFLIDRGARVELWDDAPAQNLPPEVHQLVERGVRLVTGPEPRDPLGFQGAVVSPGIPSLHPGLRALRGAGVEVIGEVELAARHLSAPMVAITGTNGKTTVTHLVGRILAEQGLKTFVGGNVGTPLIEAVDESWDAIVAELSSFQLDTAPGLKPRVAVLLNVTDDHLDRHGNPEGYRRAKAAVFANQGPGDAAVVNADDPVAWSLRAGGGCRLPYSLTGPRSVGAWVEGGDVVILLPGRDGVRIPRGVMTLSGAHALGNALAAVLAAAWMGADPIRAWAVARAFEGLPHRFETFLHWGEVRFVDDSKATNVDAAVKALETAQAPLVWLAGGSGKGADFGPLATAAKGRVRLAILVGDTAPAIAEVLKDTTPTVQAATWPDAVERAVSVASPGDTVLLCPASASFDRFSGYAERGETFQRLCRDAVARKEAT